MAAISSQQRQGFRDQGYLVERGAIGAAQLQALNAAVDRFLERAWTGELTKPIDWTDREARIPFNVGNMLTSDAYEPAFGEWFEGEILPAAEGLLENPPRCSWLSILAAGGGHPYHTVWHRDYGAVDSPHEAAVLARNRERQCSFQAALWAGDSFLQLVPGSHDRPLGEAELAAFKRDSDGAIPGQITIELEAGDIVWRHAHILHRGINPEGTARRTLLSGFWRGDTPVWKEDCGDGETMRQASHIAHLPRLRAGVERYLAAFPAGEPKSASEL